jgi:hypothetical protein
MQLDLPLPITRYFDAKAGLEPSPLADYFTADAVVWDDGEDLELRGLSRIQEWLSTTSGKYKLTTELKSATQDGDHHTVAVIVSGDFPGSPYEFSYRFTLDGNKIKELAINPIGPVGT